MSGAAFEIGMKALLPSLRGKRWLYLFMERSSAFPGETERRWDIPGGRVQLGGEDRTLNHGLAREVLQETGLHVIEAGIDRPALLDIQVIPRQSACPVVRLTSLAKSLPGPVALSGEHCSYLSLTRQEALGLNLDPYVRAVLETERNFAFDECHEANLSIAAMRLLAQAA